VNETLKQSPLFQERKETGREVTTDFYSCKAILSKKFESLDLYLLIELDLSFP